MKLEKMKLHESNWKFNQISWQWSVNRVCPSRSCTLNFILFYILFLNFFEHNIRDIICQKREVEYSQKKCGRWGIKENIFLARNSQEIRIRNKNMQKKYSYLQTQNSISVVGVTTCRTDRFATDRLYIYCLCTDKIRTKILREILTNKKLLLKVRSIYRWSGPNILPYIYMILQGWDIGFLNFGDTHI